MEYDVVIGLETHIELNTKTKVFCGCKNEFGGEPNTNCCPICIGLPGALPSVNKEAINKAIIAGLVLNCTINKNFYFDRKHYFYPDLSKSYQISQDGTPICENGKLDIETENGTKSIRIRQIHLEEDAGKLIHSLLGETYVDYNRGGVPLIEIVSMPDLSSVDEAITYVTALKEIAKKTGISDCKMEQGSLRCDVNVSLKPKNSTTLGVKVEMKNINSFKAIERAIKYEVSRQLELLNNGEKIMPETRRWDDLHNKNIQMRSKEGAKDYRFFPEPDINMVSISSEDIEKLKSTIPMLYSEIKKMLTEKYGLNSYDAGLIAKEEEITKFFLNCVNIYNNPKKIANWITSEINKKINLELAESVTVPVNAVEFVKMLTMLDENKISQQGARTILLELWGSNESTDSIINRLNLKVEVDNNALEQVVKAIIENNPKAVEDYKSGNNRAFAFFVGQVMKETKGKASASVVNELISKYLK